MPVLMRICTRIMYQPGIFICGLSPGLHMPRKMTPTQGQILMETFQANANPKEEQMDHLAISQNITKGEVEGWFSNMRHKKVAEELLKKSE